MPMTNRSSNPQPTLDTTSTRARGRKFHKRYTPVVFALYMAAFMALFMCSLIVGVNTGVGSGYVARVLGTYVIAMPSAFLCVLVMRPLVMRMVAATVHS